MKKEKNLTFEYGKIGKTTGTIKTKYIDVDTGDEIVPSNTQSNIDIDNQPVVREPQGSKVTGIKLVPIDIAGYRKLSVTYAIVTLTEDNFDREVCFYYTKNRVPVSTPGKVTQNTTQIDVTTNEIVQQLSSPMDCNGTKDVSFSMSPKNGYRLLGANTYGVHWNDQDSVNNIYVGVVKDSAGTSGTVRVKYVDEASGTEIATGLTEYRYDRKEYEAKEITGYSLTGPKKISTAFNQNCKSVIVEFTYKKN